MTKRILYFLCAAILALALTACERTKIGDITADPARFTNKEIAVAGTVTQSIGVVGAGVYQIDDGTGKLWVFANGGGVPSKGTKIGVKGRVAQSVTFLGINYATVLRETGRRTG